MKERSLDMLVLSRKKGEKIVIAGDIEVMVVELRGGRVRLGITAPRQVTVNRGEIQELIEAADRMKGGEECQRTS